MDESVKIKTEKNSITVVVEESQVESYSHQGYKLTHVVYGDYTEQLLVEQANDYHVMTISSRATVVVRRPRFVMVLDGESAVAEQAAEITRLEGRCREVSEEAFEVGKKLRLLEREIETQKATEQRLDALVTSKRAEADRLQNAKRKLEEDIGKIRTALGDLRMKEILG